MEYFLSGKGRYEKIINKTQLAHIFAKSVRTIRREIKRGLILHQRSEIPFEVIEYNADHAHTISKYEGSAKGPSIKIGSDRILEKIQINYLILKTFTTTLSPLLK